VANYVAAILIVAAVALFVAAPLSGGFPRRRRSTSGELDLERLEHDRGIAVQGLRELEFDHEMGKLDEVDYRGLKRSLEERALSAMSAIERLRGAGRAATMRLASRPARPTHAAVAAAPASAAPASLASFATPSARRSLGAANARPIVNFCPQCGVPVGAGHNYCASCGASLNMVAARIASRAE
jgi:hypothetical protein